MLRQWFHTKIKRIVQTRNHNLWTRITPILWIKYPSAWRFLLHNRWRWEIGRTRSRSNHSLKTKRNWQPTQWHWETSIYVYQCFCQLARHYCISDLRLLLISSSTKDSDQQCGKSTFAICSSTETAKDWHSILLPDATGKWKCNCIRTGICRCRKDGRSRPILLDWRNSPWPSQERI